MRKGGEVSVNLPVVQEDGSVRWFLARSHCTLAPDGTPLRMPGVLIDITDQRILEEQLRQSQKMEAVGQLTGGLAHDFNNMLQGITGSLSLLKRHLGQGSFASVDRYITAAQTDAARATTLTQRLLAFSRRQLLDPRPTNADELIAGMTDLIQRTVGPGINVKEVPTSDLWMTLCDPNQMESALLNLCINARDAMPDGGKLTIETYEHTTKMDQVTHEREPEARRIRGGQRHRHRCGHVAGGARRGLSNRSSLQSRSARGPVWPVHDLRLRPAVGRTGADMFGGGTWHRPSKSTCRGSWVIKSGRVVRSDSDEAPGAGVGETVLVVDDEPSVRMLVMEVLLERGYIAFEAADGMAGLDVLNSDAHDRSSVSDVGLPGGMNGRQMADAARVVRPDLKVLFITGYAAEAAVGDGRLDYGMQVLTKPFPLDVLAKKVKEMISPN